VPGGAERGVQVPLDLFSCGNQSKSGPQGDQNSGRCYDHNFLRCLPIFGEKMSFFSKTNVMIKFLHKNTYL
jgi:hypothetical protein